MNMKTTFALLLGLLLLESGVAMGQECARVQNAVCHVNNAIFVILIDNEGVQRSCKCDKLQGGPRIDKENSLPGGLVPVGTPTSLGTIQKHKSATDPDPCIEWVIGGTPNFYCW